MSLNTPLVEVAKKFKKKYVWWALIACIFIALCAVGINQSQIQAENDKNFNLNIVKADQDFKIDKFDDARQSYQIALDYKEDVSVENKIELCKKLDASKSEFDTGTDLFNKKNYVKAVTSFKKVIVEDEKRFNLAKDKIAESIKLFSDGEFSQAKGLVDNKKYGEAVAHIGLVLSLDPNNETAKTLNTQYSALSLAQTTAEVNSYMKSLPTEAETKALAKTKGIDLGMTTQQVLESTWGKPKSINKTVTVNGTHEQWCYSSNNYLYFDNGILTSLQQ